MKQPQKEIKSGTLDLKKDDPFELFVSATNIRYCYYAETHKILVRSYLLFLTLLFKSTVSLAQRSYLQQNLVYDETTELAILTFNIHG